MSLFCGVFVDVDESPLCARNDGQYRDIIIDVGINCDLSGKSR